jgi:hypothetical protein
LWMIERIFVVVVSRESLNGRARRKTYAARIRCL